jgi:hypothetical protein
MSYDRLRRKEGVLVSGVAQADGDESWPAGRLRSGFQKFSQRLPRQAGKPALRAQVNDYRSGGFCGLRKSGVFCVDACELAGQPMCACGCEEMTLGEVDPD